MYSENNIKILEFHNKKIEELEKKIKLLENELIRFETEHGLSHLSEEYHKLYCEGNHE